MARETLYLLRDDDANATTDPLEIERAYAPLLDAGIPVCFSVIPAVALDIRAPDGGRERFLNPVYSPSPRRVPLTADSPLARWLRRHDRSTEALMHGYSHERRREGTEFGALDHLEASYFLQQGLEIMTEALGNAPQGFVAPWDAMSRGSLLEVTRRFALVSTNWVDRGRLPLRAWPAHFVERRGRREALKVYAAWVLRHRGGRIKPSSDPGDVPALLGALGDRADVAVVVLHHWMFYRQSGPHPVIVALARALGTKRVGSAREALDHLEGCSAWRRIRSSFSARRVARPEQGSGRVPGGAAGAAKTAGRQAVGPSSQPEGVAPRAPATPSGSFSAARTGARAQ